MPDAAQSPTPTGFVSGAGGTPIAYWITGTGPYVVLIHGTTSDHSTYNELVAHLAEYRTVVTYDRRGRGASGDSPAYDFADELRDAAAVVAEAAARQGAAVDVLGHSFGAFVALAAAPLSSDIRSAVAYSPGFGAHYPPGSLARIESETASGDLATALEVMFADVIGMPADEIAYMRESPVWPVRVAAAGTVARECRADESFLREYRERLGATTVPVLVIDGTTNTAPKRQIATDLAAMVPGSLLFEMAGQGHVAHHIAAARLTAITCAFFDDPHSMPVDAAASTS